MRVTQRAGEVGRTNHVAERAVLDDQNVHRFNRRSIGDWLEATPLPGQHSAAQNVGDWQSDKNYEKNSVLGFLTESVRP